NFDALAVLFRQGDAALKNLQETLIQIEPTWCAMGLQALAGEVVSSGTVVLLSGGEQAAALLVFGGQLAELVGHLRPGFTEGLRAGGVWLLGRVLQRLAHLDDLADPRTHFHGEADG